MLSEALLADKPQQCTHEGQPDNSSSSVYLLDLVLPSCVEQSQRKLLGGREQAAKQRQGEYHPAQRNSGEAGNCRVCLAFARLAGLFFPDWRLD